MLNDDGGRAANASAYEGLDARQALEALEEEWAGLGSGSELDPMTEEHAPSSENPDAATKALHVRMVEAILFAAEEPLDAGAIAARLPHGADTEAALADLARHYESRGVVLATVGGKWRFQTAPDMAPALIVERVEPRKLSRAALETLAIIAYHQPCTRADIEDVRGVAVAKGSLDQLLEIGWIRLKGRRKDAPGRPVLFATTPAFLEHFGLASITDLPGLSDLKAAGLLDARLPPGFSVPSPVDADHVSEEDAPGENIEFSQDFLSEGEAH